MSNAVDGNERAELAVLTAVLLLGLFFLSSPSHLLSKKLGSIQLASLALAFLLVFFGVMHTRDGLLGMQLISKFVLRPRCHSSFLCLSSPARSGVARSSRLEPVLFVHSGCTGDVGHIFWESSCKVS